MNCRFIFIIKPSNIEGIKMKKIVYIDMDMWWLIFPSGIAKLDEKTKQEYEGRYDDGWGHF